jgi:predicted alpha/beta superfamily hydrolase
MRTTVAKLAAAPLVLALAASALAQEEPISIGVRVKVHSQVLNEDREVLVSLPGDYDRGRFRYPVLYVLDGDSLFLPAVASARFMGDKGLAPRMIVVGVPSGTTRTRDLTPPCAVQDKEYPGGGGADLFRRFMTTELRPFIERRYRTEPFGILIGHSFGGLFAVHAMLSEPASFDAFIAISPSLWWDKEAETATARKLFAAETPLKKFLYISHCRENNGIPAAVETFATVLGRSAPPGLRWKLDYLPGDNHGSTPARSIYNGLESLFAGFAPPEDGVPVASDVEKRYAALTEEFGFPCRPAEDWINSMGYFLLRNRMKPDEAVAMFLYGVRCYPESANTYDSLADGYEAQGRPDLALENCRTACRLAEERSDPRLVTFRKHLEAVLAKLGNRPDSLLVVEPLEEVHVDERLRFGRPLVLAVDPVEIVRSRRRELA